MNKYIFLWLSKSHFQTKKCTVYYLTYVCHLDLLDKTPNNRNPNSKPKIMFISNIN